MTQSAHTSGNTLLLTDFTTETEDLGWYVVNDNVMGGRSDGGFDVSDGTLRFTGRTNTRGGGFSSIRTDGPRMDLASFEGLRLRVKGDGRQYTWRIATNARFRGRLISYWAEFPTTDGEWTTVELPFSAFEPKFRGMALDGGPPDPAQIRGLGLMIYDGKDGAFDLTLDRVEAYAAAETFTLAEQRFKHRVLAISAPDADNEDLRRQVEDVAASRSQFEERDMLLVTLVGDGPSTAGEHSLSRQEADAVRRSLDIEADAVRVMLIGKDGTVKLSDDRAIPIDDIYGLIDSMPMRQREMSEQGQSDG